MEKYAKHEKIGEGQYGVVYKATNKLTNEQSAMKKIRIGNYRDGVSVVGLREIKLLQELSNPFIIDLKDVFVYKQNIHLIMPLMSSDLEELIKDQSIVLTAAHIKCYMKALLESLVYLHDNLILHRDLKPSNLLLAPGQIKLTDFGLAKRIVSPCGSPGSLAGKLSPQVVTRWYRAPELLFGSRHYGQGVDIWAAGCIFAELLLRRPYLPGNSDIEQLQRIFEARGLPDPKNWPGVEFLPNYVRFEWDKQAQPLKRVFTAASDDAIELLSSMLQLNPAARVSATKALQHNYFFNDPQPTPLDELPIPVKKLPQAR